MTPEQTKLYRDQILIALRSYPHGMPFGSIKTVLQASGFRLTDDAVLEGHLNYLEKKFFIAVKKQSHSLGYKVYEITGLGQDSIEEQGL